MNHGFLHRFIFDDLPVRGALVRLGADWREALARRASVGAFPQAVRALIGEMTAAGVLIQSSIKFDGSLMLQIHGDGPVKLAVAEVRSDLGFRATATVIDDVDSHADDVDSHADLVELVNPGGAGRCAITLNPHNRAPGAQAAYQGVVSLADEFHRPLRRLSEVLECYMLQSEQIETRLVLAANDETATGLLLQRMPATGGGRHSVSSGERRGGEDDDFERIALLASTLAREELLALDENTILRRLFWQEHLQRFEPQRTRFRCTCSRSRVRAMLCGLGREEVTGILAEREFVEVGCEFCGHQFRFDAVDIGHLFVPLRDLPPATRTRQ